MLIIFDWDGTLSDSTGKIVRCVQRAADDLTLPPLPDATIRDIIGLGLNEAVGRLYPELDNDGIQALASAYSMHYVADDDIPGFYPGAYELLDTLASSKLPVTVRTAVATGKSRQGLNRVLEHAQLSDYFDMTRCADETASKPNPLMLHDILNALNYEAKDAVMVGDTEFDMAMAQAIGMPRIAVDYGAHSAARLEKYQPELITGDLRNLLGWLAAR